MNRVLLAFLLCAATAGAGAQITFVASLSGSEEVPAVATSASGTGVFTLNGDRTELSYLISYQGLTGPLTAGGHFHVAGSGRTGPVVKAIAAGGDPASSTISGVWRASDATQPLTTALVESLLTGRVYVNFHTAAHPGGEIRGQVNLGTALHFTVDLDGAQNNPPVTTTAGGTGVFVLNPSRTEMEYVITYRGLSGPLSAGGHVHTGAPGASGGIARLLAAGGSPASDLIKDTWKSTDNIEPLTAALVDSAIAGRLYVNFHTAAHPGAEIRGQLVLATGTGFAASLESDKEVPPVTADGKGTAYVVLNRERTEARWAVSYFGLTGPLTAGGHFHTGGAGRTGPVAKGIALSGGAASATLSGMWRTTDATQPLTSALAESLLTGRMYANFHTAANPGGEIRGQLDMTTGVGFSVVLDGSQENPPVATAGRGSGFAVLNGERNDILYRFTYHGLTGPLTAGAHFHTGTRGAAGPVAKSIAVTGEPASSTLNGDWSSSQATQPLTPSLADSILASRVYVNVHTAANPGGEIRGQLEFPAGTATAVADEGGIVPEMFVLEQNYPNPFNPVTTIRYAIGSVSADPASRPSGAGSADVRLAVYDLLGREVAVLVNGPQAPGVYTVTFDAGGFASGMYLYRLTAGSVVRAQTMLLLK